MNPTLSKQSAPALPGPEAAPSSDLCSDLCSDLSTRPAAACDEAGCGRFYISAGLSADLRGAFLRGLLLLVGALFLATHDPLLLACPAQAGG